jgi:hypothetical protein
MAQLSHDAVPTGQVPCTYHPDVMTGLRCTRCGKPICPRCGVRTPVGLRCPDCAGVRGLPTIRTGGDVLARAALAGLAVAAVVVALWYFGPQWKFYLSLALGFGVAEAMAHVARGKRGLDLQVTGIAIVTLAAVAVRVLLAWKYGVGWDQVMAGDRLIVTDGNRLIAGSALDFVQVRAVPDLLFLAMTWAIVWIRFR